MKIADIVRVGASSVSRAKEGVIVHSFTNLLGELQERIFLGGDERTMIP